MRYPADVVIDRVVTIEPGRAMKVDSKLDQLIKHLQHHPNYR